MRNMAVYPLIDAEVISALQEAHDHFYKMELMGDTRPLIFRKVIEFLVQESGPFQDFLKKDANRLRQPTENTSGK